MCPACPTEAVAADAPKARAQVDRPVGWHHLPNPDVPDLDEATTLPPMGAPGHRLAVSRMPTFRPTYGGLESDWLATARGQYVPTEGSSRRTGIASAFHRYDRASGRFVRLPVDMRRFMAQALARGWAEAHESCFYQRREWARHLRIPPPLPPFVVRPPPGFGDAEWAESERETAAAAAAAEAAAVAGRDEVAHARRLAEVLAERMRRLGEEDEDEDEDEPYDPHGAGSEYADGDEGASGYDYGGGGGSSDG